MPALISSRDDFNLYVELCRQIDVPPLGLKAFSDDVNSNETIAFAALYGQGKAHAKQNGDQTCAQTVNQTAA